MAESNTFTWNELATRDFAGCKKFYTEVFGWSAHDQPAGKHNYIIFQKGETPVGGMIEMSAEWGDVPPHWVPYLAVDDCDACVKKITENGGKVCVPPTDIPVGRFAVVSDPNGAVFTIIRWK